MCIYNTVSLLYFIPIDIKWLKLCDKSCGVSVPISLDLCTLTWYCTYSDAFTLPIHDTVFCDVLWQWCHAIICDTLVQFLILRLQKWSNVTKFLKVTKNTYRYIIKGLLHWYWWTSSLVGTSTDARKVVSFDIPAQDNLHQYQYNNPTILFYICILGLAVKIILNIWKI